MSQITQGEFLLYQTEEDASTPIQISIPVIAQHIRHIFSEYELLSEANY
jgi:hypothetical protein